MFRNSSIPDWNSLTTVQFSLYVLIPWSYWNKTLTILDNSDTLDYFLARPTVLRRPRHLKVYQRQEQKEKCLPIPVANQGVCSLNVHPLVQLHALNITDTDHLSWKWLWTAFHYDSSPSWHIQHLVILSGKQLIKFEASVPPSLPPCHIHLLCMRLDGPQRWSECFA